ncbi:hypothetical protein Poli38472_014146 [Pythium oligandrum]|uniref:Gamma-soluble NSF attachment protein n=1 Tax=Pythium oligandrum TaxID=41045 RepID=A0A8K1CI65_PYTOL|nr:hypothetical protein Poli38472_014146 [Pythium oligandrum]|eukprot:TMW64029.1 hypothetical protein Poli38472_014146 [Pythium oligandrum]
MSALQEKKRKEADEHMKQANKLMEKTMFRWQPDYLAAAPLIEKAADAYRAAGDYERAKAAYAQAALVQNKSRSPFRAAQNCENGAKIVVQQIKETRAAGPQKDKYLAELKKNYEAACGYYSDMGELGKAADALVKGAVVCEDNGVADVKELYLRACSLMEAQGKPHFAVDIFKKTFTYLVKKELYKESLSLLKRQVAIYTEIDQRNNIHKCYLTEIVLLLTLGDVAAADQQYMAQLQSDSFLSSDECALTEDLVRAFKNGNEELLQETIRKQGFSFLDNQIGKLARKLSIYGGGGAKPSTGSSSTGSSASSSRTGSRTQSSGASKNPFAPSRAAPSRYEYESAARHAPEPTAPARAAPAASSAAMDEYDIPADSNTSTVASKDDRRANEFDFDSLEFSMDPPPAEEESTKAPAPSTASRATPPPAMEEDVLDLT